MRIYRYDLPIDDLMPVSMPKAAKLLHVASSDRLTNGVTVWAQVWPDNENVCRVLSVVGTGNPMSEEAQAGTHVGSFRADPFVWHVFDCGVAVYNEEAK